MKLIVLIFCLAFSSVAYCEPRNPFVCDLADNTKATNLGTFALQGAVCFGLSRAGKQLFDDEGKKEWDWLPGAWITIGGLLLHQEYFKEGGQDAKDAIAEQIFESGGCFAVFVF